MESRTKKTTKLSAVRKTIENKFYILYRKISPNLYLALNLCFLFSIDFTNWAFYRADGGKFTPDDIDINLCTHIVYGFAVLDKNTYQMIAHDSYVDEDKGKN